MSVRLNQEQAADFVRYALDGAVPGISFEIGDYRDTSGRPGLRARANAREYGERVYLFPPTAGAGWDAAQLVAAAVRQFTVGLKPPVPRAA
jgi:hypothetical protein